MKQKYQILNIKPNQCIFDSWINEQTNPAVYQIFLHINVISNSIPYDLSEKKRKIIQNFTPNIHIWYHCKRLMLK